MPYRGSEPVVVCYRHAAAAAAATCGRCLESICEICVVYEATRPECPRCARRTRRLRQAARAAMALLLIASSTLSLAAAAYVIMSKSMFDYGALTPTVWSLSRQLERDPCDRVAVVGLAEAMSAAGDHAGAIRCTDRFFDICGGGIRLGRLYPRLVHVTLIHEPPAAALAPPDEPGILSPW